MLSLETNPEEAPLAPDAILEEIEAREKAEKGKLNILYQILVL